MIGSTLRRAALAAVLAGIAVTGRAETAATRPAAPLMTDKVAKDASAPPKPLGALAAPLEGTWELVSMKLPDGTLLKPPVASGVIVIDKGVYLAASYVQPTPAHKIGNIWEGRIEVDGDRFDLVPKRGYSYDSLAEQRVHFQVPPRSKGVISRTAEGLVFKKDLGGTVTFPAGTNRRVQEEPDGTRIEHERTSLVPRVPDDLPLPLGEDAPHPPPPAPARK